MISPAVALPEDSGLLLFVTGHSEQSYAAADRGALRSFRPRAAAQTRRLAHWRSTAYLCRLQHQARLLRAAAITRVAFDNVLLHGHAALRGRSLAVSRFRQGAELLAYNDYINSCRIVVKKVPANIDAVYLKKIMEERFGAIARIYKYETDAVEKVVKKINQRKISTYSIEFENIEAANEAAALLLTSLEASNPF